MNPDNERHIIYTIGHGNRKTDDFIYLLKKYEIELLVDVRTYPYSRFHTQFRQAALESSLDVEQTANRITDNKAVNDIILPPYYPNPA
ncbi:MAG: DUF488 family protein [Mucilaginibacter sp.]